MQFATRLERLRRTLGVPFGVAAEQVRDVVAEEVRHNPDERGKRAGTGMILTGFFPLKSPNGRTLTKVPSSSMTNRMGRWCCHTHRPELYSETPERRIHRTDR